MGKRWAWVAWSMLAVYLVSMVAAIILSVVNGTFQPDAAGQVGLALGFSAFMVVGALVVAHRPSNAIGWIFSAIGLLAFTALLAVQYATYAYVTRPGSLPGATLAAWYGSWFPTITLALIFTPLLFPTRSAALAPLAARRLAGRGGDGGPDGVGSPPARVGLGHF
jgi:hypothetical protein